MPSVPSNWTISYIDPEQISFKIPIDDGDDNKAERFFESLGYDVGTDGYYDDPDNFFSLIIHRGAEDPLGLFRPELAFPNTRIFLNEINPNYRKSIVTQIINEPIGTSLYVIYIPSNYKDLDMGSRYWPVVDFPFREEKGLKEYEAGPPRGMWNAVDLIVDAVEGRYGLSRPLLVPVEIYDHGIHQGTIPPGQRYLEMNYNE